MLSVELDLKVTRSTTKGGALVASRIVGSGRFSVEATPDTKANPACEFLATSSFIASTISGSPFPKASGPRLEGVWHVTGGAVPGANQGFIGETPGILLESNWEFLPICGRGACDLLATGTPVGFGLPFIGVLEYEGGGVYRSGRAPLTLNLACGNAIVAPALLGWSQVAVTVTAESGGRASALEISTTALADPTQALIASQCAFGSIASTATYTGILGSG